MRICNMKKSRTHFTKWHKLSRNHKSTQISKHPAPNNPKTHQSRRQQNPQRRQQNSSKKMKTHLYQCHLNSIYFRRRPWNAIWGLENVLQRTQNCRNLVCNMEGEMMVGGAFWVEQERTVEAFLSPYVWDSNQLWNFSVKINEKRERKRKEEGHLPLPWKKKKNLAKNLLLSVELDSEKLRGKSNRESARRRNVLVLRQRTGNPAHSLIGGGPPYENRSTVVGPTLACRCPRGRSPLTHSLVLGGRMIGWIFFIMRAVMWPTLWTAEISSLVWSKIPDWSK